MTVALSLGSDFWNLVILMDDTGIKWTTNGGQPRKPLLMCSFSCTGFRMMWPHVSEIRPIADRMPATASPDRAFKDNSSTEFCRCRPEIKSTQPKVMLHRRTTTCGYQARIFIVSDYGWRNRHPVCPLDYRLSPHRWRRHGIV